MGENDPNGSPKVGIGTEQGADFLVKIQTLFNAVNPDIKKWYQGLWLFLCFVIYLGVVVFIFYEIATCYTMDKIESGKQVAIINNDNGLYFLVLFLIAIIAIICPLFFYNKLKEPDDYAIANNESYYKLVHHIINVLSDMEIRDRKKDLKNQQLPYITKEELNTMLNEYFENQRNKIEAFPHDLSNIIKESEDVKKLLKNLDELNNKLPLDETLIKIDKVVELIKALSTNGTIKTKKTFQADKVVVEDSQEN